ncbi:MAG: hypothetical protein Q9198_000486, partial [Flavoplaca austrocitrina]
PIGSPNCLLDIVPSDPRCSAGIVEEATRVLDSGEWTKARLNPCHPADSAQRDSLRVSNLMSRNVQKKVLPSSGLKNGIEGWFAP